MIDYSKPDKTPAQHLEWFEGILKSENNFPWIADYPKLYNALCEKEDCYLSSEEIKMFKEKIKSKLITEDNKSSNPIQGFVNSITDKSLETRWKKEFVQQHYQDWIKEKK